VPIAQPQFVRNNFGGTIGGPLKIPGLYADPNRRTNFQLNYAGNRSNTVFDQYATVPTQAMRTGDFSTQARARRSANQPAVSEQPDSAHPDEHRGARLAAFHPATQPAGVFAELPRFSHDGLDG
jgi:hypothetical protein